VYSSILHVIHNVAHDILVRVITKSCCQLSVNFAVQIFLLHMFCGRYVYAFQQKLRISVSCNFGGF